MTDAPEALPPTAVDLAAPGFADPDAVVVLTSPSLRLTKIHTRQADGTTRTDPYEDARHFRGRLAKAVSIGALASLLDRLRDDQKSAVIRSAVRADANRVHMRRLLHPDQDDAVTLIEVPRRWVALDFDGLGAPDRWWLDLSGTYDLVVRPALPIEFRRATCIVQASGSAGVKSGFRGRVWFLLAQDHCGAQLRRVFANVPGLDRSTLHPATLIYTARPVFIGMVDPVPVRLAIIPGEAERVAVRVPPEPPCPVAAPLRAPIDGTWGPKPAYSRAALDHACERIEQAGDKQQHPTLYREAMGIGSLVGSGHMPLLKARADLIEAGLAMKAFGRPWRREEVARQIDRGLAAGMDRPRAPGGAS
ncbi:MAG TPA: hypothetical protein VHL31_19815 [Geminicoccus sp.]|jgi:hypothetical protein|uniref:hypothetical protein n=1 Tax=Geminicoccus sp. TaxID=2024832 RepID=UPI002E30AF4A|nr:hypothetical protein [Geminicoccus sp.]HEX2528530.1 hypothetical protein [Geminicoccus sp.]